MPSFHAADTVPERVALLIDLPWQNKSQMQ